MKKMVETKRFIGRVLGVLAAAALCLAAGCGIKNVSPISTVTISGTPEVGRTLEADAKSSTGSVDDAVFQWQRGTTNSYRDISGATGSSYTLRDADLGKYIRVRATNNETDGYKYSSAVGPVIVTQSAVKGGGAMLKNPREVKSEFTLTAQAEPSGRR